MCIRDRGGSFQGPVGRTFQDPVGGSGREQSFVPRGRGGGFSRGMAKGRENPKPFVPYDTSAGCGQKGHWRNECPHEGIVLLRHRNSLFQ